MAVLIRQFARSFDSVGNACDFDLSLRVCNLFDFLAPVCRRPSSPHPHIVLGDTARRTALRSHTIIFYRLLL